MEKQSSLKSDPPSVSLDDLDVSGEMESVDRGNVQVHHAPSLGERNHLVSDLEARVDVLESALFDHATILRDRVAERLDRLEATLDLNQRRLEEGLAKEATDREERLVQLTDTFTRAMDRDLGEGESEVDPIRNVRPATENTLTDLVDALTATRSHLDTIAVALQHTRGELKA